ncbi:unnamed protein product [Durusdinium trenchii]|uniref:Uncharacterized protein n=1 Tax=Durusdinium trenchii TaxID=1381693 RepID=A0ABP0MI27_9DINO
MCMSVATCKEGAGLAFKACIQPFARLWATICAFVLTSLVQILAGAVRLQAGSAGQCAQRPGSFCGKDQLADVVSLLVVPAIASSPLDWSGVGEPDERCWLVDSLAEDCLFRKVLNWKPAANVWHWSAQSVTHIHADIDKYSTPAKLAAVPNSDMDELLYALKSAPLLSDKYTAEELRAEWVSGKFEHPMIDFLSGKSENTKWHDLVRDIHSACDVFRELLSELDINASTIGSLVEGVTARMGRKRSGLLTEEIFRRRVDVLNKAEALELQLLPIDGSQNRTRYLSDICIGPKLALEAMRNIERPGVHDHRTLHGGEVWRSRWNAGKTRLPS